MCGIAGILADRPVAAAEVQAMADTLAHRGPNDAGVWSDPAEGVALGHRRLSIVDLSAAGHQPFVSADGRWVLTYNGEIYNHMAIRGEIDRVSSVAWRGHSDTETLAEAIALWGVAGALSRCVGMFAIGVWDRRERRLSLARDRIGEKPLYYGWTGHAVAFGSELKAVRAAPGFRGEVDREVLALYVRYNYVPAPWSIYRGIYKIEPGTIMTIDRRAVPAPPSAPPSVDGSTAGVTCEAYWTVGGAVRAGAADPLSLDVALPAVERQLTEAVGSQLMGDVPVGAFLSGGIDSSLIVALMREQAPGRVRSFTIGFHEENNEAHHAAAVARHLGTEHTALFVTPVEALDVIPRLPTMYDEPFADSSQIPTFLLSQLARGSVKVALSGDAGDELFSGYYRYTLTSRLWEGVRRFPAPVRRFMGMALGSLPPGLYDRAGALPFAPQFPMLGNKAYKFAQMLKSSGALAGIYASFVEEWHAGVPVRAANRLANRIAGDPFVAATIEEQMMYWDLLTYLPDDILVKIDRAAMATGLETRVPYLDHRMVELAWRVPLSLKMRGGQGKWLLRQILYRHVPEQLIERPKAGFGVPVGRWLRGAIRDWAEDLLSEEALLEEPAFDRTAIRRRWHQHLRGSHDWTAALWSVLMYQAWKRTT